MAKRKYYYVNSKNRTFLPHKTYEFFNKKEAQKFAKRRKLKVIKSDTKYDGSIFDFMSE